MKDGISGKTTVCGLIGDPVEHSVSPALHNAAYTKLGLDYLYAAFRVEASNVESAISGMKALEIRGLNVTIPHKVAVLSLLDKLDPLAEKIEAVNTIVNDNGILTGYNTDATGFLHSLRENKFETEGKEVVIVGAGGAARAVSFVLAGGGANITVLNRLRGLHRAEELAGRISMAFDRKADALELTDEHLKRTLDKADLLVNVTSLGMHPDTESTPVRQSLLNPNLVVYDIVYNPVKTRLLREAEEAGAKTISGIDMLAWQGATAFEIWTGRKAPLELMKEVVTNVLQGNREI